MGRKTRRWLLALGLVSSLTAQAGSPVWAIHGDHNTVYLAGSVHLLKANDSRLPPAFDRAYGGSKALVMELDMSKVDQMQAASWMMEHGMLKEGIYLAPSQFEAGFNTAAHSIADIDATVRAATKIFRQF